MHSVELVKELSFNDLDFFNTVELPKIDTSKVSRFLVNPDLKDFLIEYLWEVAASDYYINMIEDATISSRRIYNAYGFLDYKNVYYIVLPSGSVVSWI